MTTDGGRRSRSHRLARELLSLVLFCAFLLAGRSSLADHYRIPTGSMEPTVEVGDRVFVSKAAYDLRLPFSDLVLVRTGAPSRGDVVVLDSPDEDLLLLKRVVAVPNDLVEVRDGRVLIEGIEITAREDWEDFGVGYSIRSGAGGGPDFGPIRVPKGAYLVLGDNRDNSRDGRVFGFVKRRAIRGQAKAVYHGRGGFTWRGL